MLTYYLPFLVIWKEKAGFSFENNNFAYCYRYPRIKYGAKKLKT